MTDYLSAVPVKAARPKWPATDARAVLRDFANTMPETLTLDALLAIETTVAGVVSIIDQGRVDIRNMQVKLTDIDAELSQALEMCKRIRGTLSTYRVVEDT